MDPNSAIVAILCTACVFLSPAAIVAIVLKHRERMTALKNRMEGAPAIIAELNNLRNEMTQLRETTTRYDMSFDAALQRVEERIESVEQNPAANHYTGYGSRPTVAEDSPTVLRRG